MAEPVINTAMRIDRALARIEAAARALADDRNDLARRNTALCDSVADAIRALDQIIARQGKLPHDDTGPDNRAQGTA